MKRPVWIVIALVVVLALWALWPRKRELKPEAVAPRAEDSASTSHPSESPAPIESTSPTTAPQAADSTTPTPSVPAPTDTSMTREEFHTLMQQALEKLPLKKTLRSLPAEEVEHKAPNAILESGQILGRIKEVIAQNPGLAPDAVEFYQSCASSPDYPNSVRALCLANGESYADKAHMPFEAKVPSAVRALADKLPGQQQ